MPNSARNGKEIERNKEGSGRKFSRRLSHARLPRTIRVAGATQSLAKRVTLNPLSSPNLS